MAENKKRQQIILLHGSDAFTTGNTLFNELSKGELVIEHGINPGNVKLHTKDNAGNLATFISEAAITAITNPIATDVDDLEAVLSGFNTDGAVNTKFTEVEALISQNATAITAINEAIGAGAGADSITGRLKTLEDTIGETSDTGKDSVWGAINAANKSIEDTEQKIGTSINAFKTGLTTTTVAGTGAVVTDVTQTDGKISVTTGSVQAQYVKLTSGTSNDANVQTFFNDYTGKTASTDKKIEDIEGYISAVSGDTSSLKQILSGYTGANAVKNAIAAAKTVVSGESENDVNPYVKVTSSVDSNDKHNIYAVSIVNAASSKDVEDLKARFGTETGSTKEIAEKVVAEVVNGAPEAFDTLKEIADWITADASGTTAAKMIQDIEALKQATTGYSKDSTIQSAMSDVTKSVEELGNFVKADDFITVTVENTEDNKISVVDTVNEGKHSVTLNFDEMVIDGGEY